MPKTGGTTSSASSPGSTSASHVGAVPHGSEWLLHLLLHFLPTEIRVLCFRGLDVERGFRAKSSKMLLVVGSPSGPQIDDYEHLKGNVKKPQILNLRRHFSGRGGGGGLQDNKFQGDGQVFKGKLIGVLEVPEARGDRMCQNAIQELKMAIRASGEHKQRVVIHIAVDGLKIRDEKTGVS